MITVPGRDQNIKPDYFDEGYSADSSVLNPAVLNKNVGSESRIIEQEEFFCYHSSTELCVRIVVNSICLIFA